MYKIFNLEKPCARITDIVMQVAEKCSINQESLAWHQSIQADGLNIVSGTFVSNRKLSLEVQKQYSNLKFPVTPMIGVLENVDTNHERLACYPPHSDRIRCVAINYYLDLGGKKVETVFYDRIDDHNDAAGGHVVRYDSVKKISSCITTDNAWYCFNARRYHSVENIESKRIILSLSFRMRYETFVSDTDILSLQ